MKIIFILMFFTSLLSSQTDIYDTGGPLMPEQAAYDVTFYDLNLQVSPEDSTIKGWVGIQAKIVQPIDYFVVDLDTLLSISRILEVSGKDKIERRFDRETGKIWIELGSTRQAGEKVDIEVFYQGKPRVAVRAPWDGGFTWSKTIDGSPWIATTCQGEGPDIWWPSKDHVSDEPDSMGIHIRVPDPLICATNGKLISVEQHDDKTSTYHWFVSTTINNYNVALNIAPYKLIEQDYTSTYGDIFPVKFWVLPEDYEKGIKIFPEFIDHLRFFENSLGPYPFRADKYGVAQTPHLGMEHQTIIAYGANFNNGSMTGGTDWGFDALHHHELAHEWWGNLVTNTDWKDMWIHEGFGTYMQALYMEHLKGMEGYHSYMDARRGFSNTNEIAPKRSVYASEIHKAPIYVKGAWVLHTLRYLIGDEALKRSLRRMAYPTPQMEKITDGSHTRFVTTNDFKQIVEKISGKKLDWFFEVYAHQPFLPQLKVEQNGNTLFLSWVTPGNMHFPMPINVQNGEKVSRIGIAENGTSITFDPKKELVIDPQKWVLLVPFGLEEALTLLNSGKYGEAKINFEKNLLFDREDSKTKNILKHIEFVTSQKGKSTDKDFNRYIGRYRINKNRDFIIVKEDENFYLQSRRSKYRMYPISEKQFIILEFYSLCNIELDENEKPTQLIMKAGSRNFNAKYIDKVLDKTL